MARFSGTIGFIKTEESDPVEHPSVYREVVTEKQYYGDVFSNNNWRWDQNGNLNENLSISHRISVVADSFAKENLGYMRFVRWLGDTWKIVNAEIQYPRIVVTLGGQYHEPEKN